MGKEAALYNELERLGIVTRSSLTNEELSEIHATPIDDLPDDIYYTDEYYATDPNETDEPENRIFWRINQIADSEIMIKLAVLNLKTLKAIKICAIVLTIFVGIALLLK